MTVYTEGRHAAEFLRGDLLPGHPWREIRLTDGIIEMSTPSDSNPRPHDGPELVIVRGDARFEMSDTFVRGKFKDARFVASDKAAKIRKGDSWVVVDGNGVIVSHEPVVGADPDPN